jgi:hypothetical protein
MTLLHTRDRLIQQLVIVYQENAEQIMLRIFIGVISSLGLDSQNHTSRIYITGKSS